MSVPQEELKATHAPLMSSAYFMNEYCKDYSDDYMLCKRANQNPEKCALEGRKVTRCAFDLMQKLSENCPTEFTNHWKCLEVSNNYYWKCRDEERVFNKCVFEKMGLKKVIPDAPTDQMPIYMRDDSQRLYK